MQAELVNVLSDKSSDAYQKTKPILQQVSQGNKDTIKIAITVIRNILQTDKHKVHIKLNAMRFLRDCFQTGNRSFLKATVDYILPHMRTIAMHSVDSSKYDQYAEKQYIDKEDLVKFKSYIQSLFTLNSECIKNWSDWMEVVQPGGKNPWLELKMELEGKKILMPIQDQYFKEKNKDAFISNYRKWKTESKEERQSSKEIRSQVGMGQRVSQDQRASQSQTITESQKITTEPTQKVPKKLPTQPALPTQKVQSLPPQTAQIPSQIPPPQKAPSMLTTVNPKKPNYSDNIRRIVTTLRQMAQSDCNSQTAKQLKQLEQQFQKALDDYANFQTNFDEPFINQSYEAYQQACQKIRIKLKNIQTPKKVSNIVGSNIEQNNVQPSNRVTFGQPTQSVAMVQKIPVRGTIEEQPILTVSKVEGKEVKTTMPSGIKVTTVPQNNMPPSNNMPTFNNIPPPSSIPPPSMPPPNNIPTATHTIPIPTSTIPSASKTSKHQIQQVQSQVIKLLQQKQRMLQQALRIKTRIEEAGATKLHRQIQLQKQQLLRITKQIEDTKKQIDQSNQVSIAPPITNTELPSKQQWCRVKYPEYKAHAPQQHFLKKCIFKLDTLLNQHTFLQKYELVTKTNKQQYIHMRLKVGCNKDETIRACRIENTPEYNVWKKPPEFEASSGRVTQEIIVSTDKMPQETVYLIVESDMREVVMQLPVMLISFLKAGQVESMDLVKAFQMYEKRTHRSKIIKMDTTIVDSPSTLKTILQGDIITSRHGTMINAAYLYEPHNILLLVSIELLSNQRMVIRTLGLDDKYGDTYSKELLKNLEFLLGSN